MDCFYSSLKIMKFSLNSVILIQMLLLYVEKITFNEGHYSAYNNTETDDLEILQP